MTGAALAACRTAIAGAACLALAALAPIAGATGAEARTVCGKKTYQQYGETRARFQGTLATLRPDGSAHAVIYHADKTAPLGWSHSLRLWRANHNSNWQVQVVAVLDQADTSQEFELQVDRKPPIAFTPGMITTPISVNEYELGADLDSDVKIGIRDAIVAGKRLEWRYASASGGRSSVRFSLSGLRAAIDWLGCAQGGE
ncbi:MAG: hypothetical protein GC150_03730 [Rhizobiales bacterium]|nr:hypothetical protein [Hyphomicrobiales bacterium]